MSISLRYRIAALLGLLPPVSDLRHEFARLAVLANGPIEYMQAYEFVKNAGGGYTSKSCRPAVAVALQIAANWSAERRVTKAAGELLAFYANKFESIDDQNVRKRMVKRLWRELQEATEESSR